MIESIVFLFYFQEPTIINRPKVKFLVLRKSRFGLNNKVTFRSLFDRAQKEDYFRLILLTGRNICSIHKILSRREAGLLEAIAPMCRDFTIETENIDFYNTAPLFLHTYSIHSGSSLFTCLKHVIHIFIKLSLTV